MCGLSAKHWSKLRGVWGNLDGSSSFMNCSIYTRFLKVPGKNFLVDRRTLTDRNNRTRWKQANLCCARSKDAVECVYGATMASVKMAGLIWRRVAVGAGLVSRSDLHAVADGA